MVQSWIYWGPAWVTRGMSWHSESSEPRAQHPRSHRRLTRRGFQLVEVKMAYQLHSRSGLHLKSLVFLCFSNPCSNTRKLSWCCMECKLESGFQSPWLYWNGLAADGLSRGSPNIEDTASHVRINPKRMNKQIDSNSEATKVSKVCSGTSLRYWHSQITNGECVCVCVIFWGFIYQLPSHLVCMQNARILTWCSFDLGLTKE